ncbi:MAG TPA: heme o synthase [Candidatus Saccharimonadales bacterium]|nr:heme o synthase [Candidatus Saccharimonadales bacterium]
MIKHYYSLTKPGIIYGNLLPAVAGFLLASKGNINFFLFISMLLGTSLIIGSGCVFNNYIDRHIDKKMTRTKNRALVVGLISGRNAIIYGTILGILGIITLYLYTNLLTALVGLIGFFVYVVLYGISKRKSPWGTIVGSIAGATPPLAGYLSVTNHFDMGALLLFLILVFWQMPHFYGIAIYRLNDYSAASLPILPVKNGIFITKIHMLLYTIAFVITTLALTWFGYTGFIYFIITALLGLLWIGLSIKGFWAKDDKKWARKMFLFSLIILTLLCIVISIDSFISSTSNNFV